ncbi:aldo/keto reductase [Flavobacterium cellulosilyticum]|uniref:Aldo/keto reductase n=1 Tax=Flavobacterium cellulosilyticum TaxID=2541731 RepID=A0A4R5C6K3_9FLAO|nr:aldo/keto reductase [Flavobacterium cellulosilyticum]TDD94685.1 aldo/keto reductase [Flavobacterium cellulosilyticum]
MKKVKLYKDIESSVIGFGCAPILGAVDAQKAKEAINFAMEMGVNHFDLARSYGYGEAENFVGKLLISNRKNIVISSKFGIKANFKAKLFRPLKPIARNVIDIKKKYLVKANEEKVSKKNIISNTFHNRIELNPKEMILSLEESLKSLKTDYLDYFFIHEPLEKILNIDELLETGMNLKKVGKIRAFGIAFMQSENEIHREYLDEFDILQYNNSPGITGYNDLVKNRGGASNIFFSPINGGDYKLTAEEKLLKLHLDFPKSVILCSMFNKKHIQNNVSIFK